MHKFLPNFFKIQKRKLFSSNQNSRTIANIPNCLSDREECFKLAEFVQKRVDKQNPFFYIKTKI